MRTEKKWLTMVLERKPACGTLPCVIGSVNNLLLIIY